MPAIVFLLGNRDVQVHKDHPSHPVIDRYFVHQNDGVHKVIDKRRGAGFQFLEASNATIEVYEELKAFLVFPMIEDTISFLGFSHPRLIFCGTKQDPPYHQDTYDFADLASLYFSDKGYDTTVSLVSCDPNNFKAVADYFIPLFEGIHQTYGPLVISNSGGTPTMRAASHFAGVFKGYQYLHILSSLTDDIQRQEITCQTFEHQELMILKEIISKDLEMYDYEGIRLLPNIPDKVKTLCEEAIRWYNLDTPLISHHDSYEQKSLSALTFIYSNMKVCFKKGAYAETIGRIFRLEEAIGQALLYKFLHDSGMLTDREHIVGLVGEQGKPVGFMGLLGNKWDKEAFISTLLPHIIFHETDPEHSTKQDSYFIHQPHGKVKTKAVSNGKNFYYFLFKSLGLHEEMYAFWEKPNGGYQYPQNPLTQLRNNSLLGHGFQGVSKRDLEEVTGDFQTFCEGLIEEVLRIWNVELSNVFDQQNQHILTALS